MCVCVCVCVNVIFSVRACVRAKLFQCDLSVISSSQTSAILFLYRETIRFLSNKTGKSTVLSYLKNKSSSLDPSLPTIGFNVERIETENGMVMMVWDIGGQNKVRKLWMDYCKEMEGRQ